MKVEFELLEKKFTKEDGTEIKYYVLRRTLVDNTTLEIPVKGDKSKLLLMSLVIENKIVIRKEGKKWKDQQQQD